MKIIIRLQGKEATFEKAQEELKKLQNTSMQISVTRDMERIRTRKAEIDDCHPDWKYGLLISNSCFVDLNVIESSLLGWDVSYNGNNVASDGAYAEWFSGECKNLQMACTARGCQGLELDCPIVIFGGEYIRREGKWITNGDNFNRNRNKFNQPDVIVENSFRVLLTRARREMILLIPDVSIFDETYQYFIDMGMDEL